MCTLLAMPQCNTYHAYFLTYYAYYVTYLLTYFAYLLTYCLNNLHIRYNLHIMHIMHIVFILVIFYIFCIFCVQDSFQCLSLFIPIIAWPPYKGPAVHILPPTSITTVLAFVTRSSRNVC
jgi:hypothetical protein